MQDRSFLSISFLCVAILLGVCNLSLAARDCNTHSVPYLSIKEGYCVYSYANLGVGKARGLDVAPNGDLLVLSATDPASIVALYEDPITQMPISMKIAEEIGLNHAIKYHNGFVYASTQSTVYRWRWNGPRTPLSNRETVVSGIPVNGHQTRTIEFGNNNNMMYISIGSAGNVDPDSSRSRIVRFNLDSAKPLPLRYPGDSELFADGTRNEVGIRMDPFGRLWGVENGMDNLNRFSVNPPLYITNPAEEVNIFTEDKKGQSWGYPWCWTEGIGERGNRLSFPGGLGNGTVWALSSNDPIHTDEWCRTRTVASIFTMQAHSAPLDIYFDTNVDNSVLNPRHSHLGQSHVNLERRINSDFGEAVVAAVIPKHGSWNRPSDWKAGYSVDYLALDAQYGIVGPNIVNLITFEPDGRTRPVAAARSTCIAYGSCLFISDDAGGRILAIAQSTNWSPSFPSTLSDTDPRFIQEGNRGSLQLSQNLKVDWYASIKTGIFYTNVTHFGNNRGWYSFLWNRSPRMTGSAVVVLDSTGHRAGSILISERTPDSILASIDKIESSWGYSNIQAKTVDGTQYLSFERPIKCDGEVASIKHPDPDNDCFDIPLDGKTSMFATFAYHSSEGASVNPLKMPLHSGASSFQVRLSLKSKSNTNKSLARGTVIGWIMNLFNWLFK